jgi:hypothetical protein
MVLHNKYNKLLSTCQKLEKVDILKKVNSFFNEYIEYVSDEIQFTKDHWQTLTELLTTSRGDCDDYTISKYITLKILGFKIETLFLVFSRFRDVNHLYLMVEIDNHRYLLDNRYPHITEYETTWEYHGTIVDIINGSDTFDLIKDTENHSTKYVNLYKFKEALKAETTYKEYLYEETSA